MEQFGAGGDLLFFSSCRSSCRSPETWFSSCWCRADRRHCFFFGGPHGFHSGQVSTASPGPVHVSADWVQLRDDATSKPYFWNRRTRATMWKPPPGIRVVWGGEKGSEGGSGTGTRVPVPVHMTSLLCLLSEAHRGEGLGIPLTPSRVPLLAVWFGVVLLPEEYLDLDYFGRFLPSCFRILQFLGCAVDTVLASVVGGFVAISHIPCEGGFDSWTVFGVSTSNSYAAVTVPVSVPREVYRTPLFYWEMISGISVC